MLIAPLSFASDLKITQRTTAPEVLATSTTYMQGPRTRYEARSVNGYQAWSGGPWVSVYGHRFATILQCDKKRAISLDLDAHEYTSYEINDLGRPVRNQAAQVPIPPVQTEPSGASLDVYVDDVDTGERKTLFGYTARRSIRTERRVPGAGAVSQAQEIKRDAWYIDLDFPDGCPRGQFIRTHGAAAVATLRK
jgi:hypothetical protein